MNNNRGGKRQWSDSELADAVANSRSWRGVMRELGLNATSAGSVRSAKRHAVRLGLDSSHFTGQRTWSDTDLRRVASYASTWTELVTELGLAGANGSDLARIKAHAVRLGLDLTRLAAPETCNDVRGEVEPHMRHLRDAGASLAAAWFLFRGYNVAFPLEPTVYDLLVSMEDRIKRIQVKTTTFYGKDGWQVQVGRRPYSIGNRGRLIPYDPDIIDLFFIVDGDLTMYLIPSRVISGRVGILLRTYASYRVGSAAGLMRTPLAS